MTTAAAAWFAVVFFTLPGFAVSWAVSYTHLTLPTKA